jgi:hypothetical protein
VIVMFEDRIMRGNVVGEYAGANLNNTRATTGRYSIYRTRLKPMLVE